MFEPLSISGVWFQLVKDFGTPEVWYYPHPPLCILCSVKQLFLVVMRHHNMDQLAGLAEN